MRWFLSRFNILILLFSTEYLIRAIIDLHTKSQTVGSTILSTLQFVICFHIALMSLKKELRYDQNIDSDEN